MPRTQEGLARLVRGEGVTDRIVEAFGSVDRRDFVPDDQRSHAYQDRPIKLPRSQTTSQPSLIARMIAAVEPQPSDRALEVGTGYGFQTALLARLVDRVFSIERHEELATAARANLERAGLGDVEVVVGDGWQGLADEAPFDVIVVSASASDLPQDLVEQLAEGGRLVIPLARPLGDDVLVFVKRDGAIRRGRLVTPARFVPLVKGSV
jgi:protein-L-isoaspartate(D-aspartate) O-methyltransferase